MIERTLHNPPPYDDDFEDQPSQSWFHKWALGVALPAVIIGFGVHGVVTQHATWFGDHANMRVHGLNATLYGLAAISVGVFLHCHYFWGNIYNQAWFAVLGKIISAIAFIATLVSLLIRVGIYGMR